MKMGKTYLNMDLGYQNSINCLAMAKVTKVTNYQLSKEMQLPP